MDKNTQQIIDRARAVCASWEQWIAADTMDDVDDMYVFVENGMKRLTAAIDAHDQQLAMAEMAKINQETGQYDGRA